MKIRTVRIIAFAAASAATLYMSSFASTLAADDWQDGAGPEWRDVLAKGRQEGKIVLAMGAPIGDKLTEAFKRDTGINLEFIGGSSETITARVMREAETENLSMDVLIGGSSEIRLLHRGTFRPIKPILMLPKVADAKYWRGGGIHWIDIAQENYLQAAEFTAARVFVNADKIDPNSLKTFSDLLKPEYKGKIAASDPTGGAGGPGFAEAVTFTFGEKFLLDLYKGQDVKITRNGTQLVEWAARGTYPIILGSLSANIDKFVSEGFPIQYVDFSDWPTFTTGGRSVMKLAANSKNPNAAIVFVNWYLSKSTQEMVQDLLEEPTRRADVDHHGIPEYMFPKPGRTYKDSYGEDYVLNFRPGVVKKIREAIR